MSGIYGLFFWLLLVLDWAVASQHADPYKPQTNNSTADKKQTLRKQIARMLNINPDKLGVSKSAPQSANAATRYMQKLYYKHIQNPGPYEGSTVRSILPHLTSAELEDANDMSQLVFNLDTIQPNEQVLRAELHFNQRLHRNNFFKTIASEHYKAKMRCAGCRPEVVLQLDRILTGSRQWSTFMATNLISNAVDNNQSQVEVQFTRREIPILAPKAIKVHSPFLLVFTQQITDSTSDESRGLKRSKRSTNSYYYQYLPVDDADDQITTLKAPVINPELHSDAVWRNNFEKFRDAGPRLLKERTSKKNKRPRYDPDDPMMGFGRVDDESDRNRVDKKSQLQSEHNELTVYLLGNDQSKQADKKQCDRHQFVINFREIGWDDWIIAPKKFEAYYCAGSCEFPLAQNTNPSNHAQLQSIAHSMGLLPPTAGVCCAPNQLDSQTLLYYDESGNVVLKNYPRMVVSSCACT